MKKSTALFLIMTFALLVISGCNEKKEPNNQTPSPTEIDPEPESDPTPETDPTQEKSISLSETSYSFSAIGQTVQLNATVTPASESAPIVAWKSSNTSVATVSNNGLVTCTGFGDATITATVDDMSATCAIGATFVAVESVEMLESVLEFSGVGQSERIVARVTPSNATYSTVTWESSNTAVATVNSEGFVICRGFGNAIITANAGGKSATCSVFATYRTVNDICGNTYKCVSISNQVWMMENMRCNKYDTQSERAGVSLGTSDVKTNSPYYTDGRYVATSHSTDLTPGQRDKLGYLYNWAAAVALPNSSEVESLTSPFSGNRQGICPNGWHVPTEAEWKTLLNYVGIEGGKKLKTTSGWYDDGNGTDIYSFAVLPAGAAFGSHVEDIGDYAYFWTSTTSGDGQAFRYDTTAYIDSFFGTPFETYAAFSVRCVKN